MFAILILIIRLKLEPLESRFWCVFERKNRTKKEKKTSLFCLQFCGDLRVVPVEGICKITRKATGALDPAVVLSLLGVQNILRPHKIKTQVV